MGPLSGHVFGPNAMFAMLFWPTVAVVLLAGLVYSHLTRRPW